MLATADWLSEAVTLVVVPVGAAVMSAGWKVLARPGDPTGEDALLVFEMLVGAATLQATYIARDRLAPAGTLPPDQLQWRWNMLLAILLLSFATAVGLRVFAYEDRGARRFREGPEGFSYEGPIQELPGGVAARVSVAVIVVFAGIFAFNHFMGFLIPHLPSPPIG